MIRITSKERQPIYDIIICVKAHDVVDGDKKSYFESPKFTVTLSELQEVKKEIDLYYSGKATHLEVSLNSGGSIYLSKSRRDKTSIEIKNVTKTLK